MHELRKIDGDGGRDLLVLLDSQMNAFEGDGMTSMKRLREAMLENPCGAHKDACPIPPKKGKERGCNWGHSVIEFADRCDDCAGKFLAALKVGAMNVAQRMHHQKTRAK